MAVLRPWLNSGLATAEAGLAAAAPARPADGPVALLLTGDGETAGDRAAAEWLAGQGFAVRRGRGPEALSGVALVAVTRTAARDRLGPLRSAPVPVLAWNGLVELGPGQRQHVGDAARRW